MVVTPTIQQILEWLAVAGVSDDTLTDLRAYASDEAAREADRASARDDIDDGAHPIITLDQRVMMGGRKIKWYRHKRSTKAALCLHHTAVRGGFGAPRSLVERIRAGRVAFPRLVNWPSPSPDEADVTRLFAIAARYRGEQGEGVPYHAVITSAGAVVINLPFDLISWHGNGANTSSLGVAWDGDSRYEQPRDREAAIAAICSIVDLARAEGHPISSMTFHSQWTTKPHDPGPVFVETIAAPAAARLGLLLDRAHASGGGRRLADAP